MQWLKQSEGVFYTDLDIVQISRAEIAFLKELVLDSPSKRVRICAHKSADSLLHEMLIVIGKNSYIRPHKHSNKSESFHLIEGKMDVIIFDAHGEIARVIPMGTSSTNDVFFYRLSVDQFHTIVIHSDIVVFHEVTNGPFNIKDTIFAPFAPVDSEDSLCYQYTENLRIKLDNYKQLV